MVALSRELGVLGGPGGDVGVNIPAAWRTILAILQFRRTVKVPLGINSIYNIVSMGKSVPDDNHFKVDC